MCTEGGRLKRRMWSERKWKSIVYRVPSCREIEDEGCGERFGWKIIWVGVAGRIDIVEDMWRRICVARL